MHCLSARLEGKLIYIINCKGCGLYGCTLKNKVGSMLKPCYVARKFDRNIKFAYNGTTQ